MSETDRVDDALESAEATEPDVELGDGGKAAGLTDPNSDP